IRESTYTVGASIHIIGKSPAIDDPNHNYTNSFVMVATIGEKEVKTITQTRE
ncbi:hypothetical protein SK128_015056, partial [Halocaridina rubra]